MQRELVVDLAVMGLVDILRSIMEMCMRKVGHKRLALGAEHMRAEQRMLKRSSLMVE